MTFSLFGRLKTVREMTGLIFICGRSDEGPGRLPSRSAIFLVPEYYQLRSYGRCKEMAEASQESRKAKRFTRRHQMSRSDVRKTQIADGGHRV